MAFVSRLVAGLTAYPAYYAHMGARNRRGAAPADLSAVTRVDPGELRKRIAGGEWVVDLRSRVAFARAHLTGTVSVALDVSFATYLGWLIPWGTPLTLIGGTEHDVAEAQRQLVRIGIDRPAGAWFSARQRSLGPTNRCAVTPSSTSPNSRTPRISSSSTSVAATSGGKVTSQGPSTSRSTRSFLASTSCRPADSPFTARAVTGPRSPPASSTGWDATSYWSTTIGRTRRNVRTLDRHPRARDARRFGDTKSTAPIAHRGRRTVVRFVGHGNRFGLTSGRLPKEALRCAASSQGSVTRVGRDGSGGAVPALRHRPPDDRSACSLSGCFCSRPACSVRSRR